MTKNAKVTPWDVEGVVDYDKLIKEFGVNYITKEQKEYLKKLAEKKGLSESIFLKRELFFSQMDLGKVIEEHKAGKPIFLYTGRAPGGSMHIGHTIPFLFNKFLQDIFDCNLYIQIPDDEKMLFKKDLTRKKITEMTKSDLDDIAAFGFNPDKTFIFKNLEFVHKMYPLVLEISKRLTLSQAKNTFGFENSSNIGQIFYPAMQIFPSQIEKGQCLIPCAIDQNPYFLLQRDIAPKLGYKKNATILCKFLTPLTGPEGKMSASDPTKAILLTDEPNIVKNKVNKYAYSGGRDTLEEHRKLGGDTSIDVSYQWLYYLFEEDDKKIQRIKDEYESGQMLSGEIKKILIDKINDFLAQHNKNKETAKKKKLLDKYMYSGKLAKETWNREFI